MKPSTQQRSNRITLWFVLIVGLTLSFISYKVALKLENKTLQTEQKTLTLLARDALDKELKINQNILLSIRHFFIASTHVSRAEFTLFTSAEIDAHTSLQALEWIPRVAHAQREEFRLRAVSDGLPDYNITQRNARNEMVTANQRAEYFPVYYVEPLQHNMSVLGFDLASNAERLATLEAARNSRSTQATASITLLQAPVKQKGFLIVQPVYKHSDESAHSEAEFMGFALGVYRISDLIESAIKPIATLLQRLQIEVSDITDLDNPVLLHSIQPTSETTALTGQAWQQSRDVHLADRHWRLTSKATAEFSRQHANNTHWIVLGVGIILTLLITSYIRTMINRADKIKKLVNRRTHELKSSEEMNRTIVENAVDAVITINDLGAIQLFSPAAVKMFGYTPEEVVGQNVKMLMPEPYRAEHDGYLLHHKKTGEKRIIGSGREVVGLRKNGDTFPMNLSVGKAQVSGKTIYVGTVTDLTKLKKNEQSLRDFSDRLDLATRAGGIGIWDFDITRGTMKCDERMYEIYSLPRQHDLPTFELFSKVIHPDDRQRIEAELKTAIKGGSNFDTEFRIQCPDGEERFIQATGLVLYDDKGYGHRMIGVNMDISEHKRAEQTMLLAKQAAEEANRQKSAFLDTMSHELRTPLTVVLGYLPLLKNTEHMPPPETIATIAQDMDISGQHLLEMINDLLDISKIEAGEMRISLKQEQSLPIIQDILRKFDNQAKQKGIQILCDAEDFSFQVDERRLRQILINLVGNALKFTSEGSITLSATRDEAFATFSVSDTGIGIEQSELPHIFETFRQVDNTSTRKTGGSGLGLAITRRLVTLHGGNIEATSTPGAGTRFTFTIKQ